MSEEKAVYQPDMTPEQRAGEIDMHAAYSLSGETCMRISKAIRDAEERGRAEMQARCLRLIIDCRIDARSGDEYDNECEIWARAVEEACKDLESAIASIPARQENPTDE